MTGCVRIVLVVLLAFRISFGQRDLISNNPSSSPWKPIRKDDVGETTYANDVTTKNNLSDNGLETSSEGPRPKRGVIHLYNMLSCATGCNPLIYKGYGCYCGFLGSGRPVDGIDSCCKRHDWCYNNSNCPFFLEYFVPYHWKCHSGRPLCGIQRGHSEAKNSCSFRLCECDRIFSECLKRFPCPSRRAICRSSAWRLVQNKIMFFTLF